MGSSTHAQPKSPNETVSTLLYQQPTKMKTACAIVAAASAVSAMTLDADVHLFQSWKMKHGKVYHSDEHEMAKYQTFKQNAAYINEHNMQNKGFTLALNQFADMTNDEYKAFLGQSQKQPVEAASTYLPPSNVNLPTEVDWRKEGYVTPVKNQGQCGSCWAFSTVASLEGQYFKKNGHLESLSEQQLVDCSSSFGNMGCNGGLMDNGFSYIKTLANGLDTEASYPYTARDGSCKASSGSTPTPGATAVAIDASHSSFQHYSHGVYHSFFCSSTRLD